MISKTLLSHSEQWGTPVRFSKSPYIIRFALLSTRRQFELPAGRQQKYNLIFTHEELLNIVSRACNRVKADLLRQRRMPHKANLYREKLPG